MNKPGIIFLLLLVFVAGFSLFVDRLRYESRKRDLQEARIELPPVDVAPRPLPPEEPLPPPPPPPSLPPLPALPSFEEPRKLRWDDVVSDLLELDAATKERLSKWIGNAQDPSSLTQSSPAQAPEPGASRTAGN